MEKHLYQNSKVVLKENGKSFYFAGVLLGQKRLEPIAKLYAVCRYIDDCADENSPEVARPLILAAKQIVQALAEHKTFPTNDQQLNLDTHHQIFAEYTRELIQLGVNPTNILELIAGAEFDLNDNEITELKELLHYCYLVAGVVGLMMCPLLGTKALEAAPYATDLGIGMQLTNICRDILADFRNSRIYLPELRKWKADLHREDSSFEIKKIVKKYLDLADEFYINAYRGISYLPLRSRLTILIAGEVYRHIGVKIRKNQYETLHGRTSLSIFEKAGVALWSIRFLFKKCFWAPEPHQNALTTSRKTNHLWTATGVKQ